MSLYDERDVYLEVAMYGDLAQYGPALADLVELAYNQFFAQLDHPALMMGDPRGGQRNRMFVFNEKNWAKFRQELLEGLLGNFHLFSWYENEEEGSVLCGELKIPPILRDPQEPRILACNINLAHYKDGFDAKVQTQWVGLACVAFQKLNGVNGYITSNWISTWCSPYEQGLEFEFGEIDFRHKLRGYYWGNFLSCEHIAQLGGIERIKQEAPCYLVEDLSGTEERVYLQLTADLADVPDEALSALREYLDPLLPK